MAKKTEVMVCLKQTKISLPKGETKVVWVPVPMTPERMVASFDLSKEYSVYPDVDDRFDSENARIFFDGKKKIFKDERYYVVLALGIIAPISIFGYTDLPDAVDHFFEITNQLHKQKQGE